MIFYKCDRCGAKAMGEPKRLDADNYKSNGIGLGKHDLCRQCYSKIYTILVAWIRDAAFLENEVKDLILQKSQSASDCDIDDFNSAWGGAGPDCMAVRREAAQG